MSAQAAITVKAQVRTSCDTAATVVESKCAVYPYLKSCGKYQGTNWLSIGYICEKGNADYCPGAWDRCVSDVNQADWSDFVGPWEHLNQAKAKLNQAR